ncbi:MAG: phosphodiester glycosidase family protein, partial [Chloroflexales bacterium]
PVARTPTASPLSVAPLPTLMPTATVDATAAPDSGWLAAGAGAELRRLRVRVGTLEAAVSIVRLDPARVRFSVGYSPTTPPTLPEWAATAGALAVINGGFFDATGQTVALLVHAGQPVGTSYAGRGGMFAVAADGAITLRALADTPYDPAESLAEALQGWPMLVRPGGEAAYTFEDGMRDRRCALALDRAGHVLLIAAPTAVFTLAELSAWLATSDLGIITAVNLDGGASSGLMLLSATNPERIDAFTPLPIVLLALPR